MVVRHTTSILEGQRILPLLLLLILAMVFTTAGSGTLYQQEKEETETPARQEKLEQDLKTTGNKLLRIIENGDPQALSALCSKKGVVFGIDQPEISLREIQKQIRGKYGVYCLIFDTTCLRKHPAFQHRYAYRD